jgi:hypothetical protein
VQPTGARGESDCSPNSVGKPWKMLQTTKDVCAVPRRRFPVGANPIRQPLQPEAIGAVMEVTKWLNPPPRILSKAKQPAADF